MSAPEPRPTCSNCGIALWRHCRNHLIPCCPTRCPEISWGDSGVGVDLSGGLYVDGDLFDHVDPLTGVRVDQYGEAIS